MRGQTKPIRVFYSTLTNRFYASRAYQEKESGEFIVNGEKFDVTNDIAGLMEQHGVTFEKKNVR